MPIVLIKTFNVAHTTQYTRRRFIPARTCVLERFYGILNVLKGYNSMEVRSLKEVNFSDYFLHVN